MISQIWNIFKTNVDPRLTVHASGLMVTKQVWCRVHHFSLAQNVEVNIAVVFEGSLFEHIQRRGLLTEHEASKIIRDLADALDFLHHKGETISYIGKL